MEEDAIWIAIEENRSREIRNGAEGIVGDIRNGKLPDYAVKHEGNVINIYLQTQKMAAPVGVLQIQAPGVVKFQTSVFEYQLKKSLYDAEQVKQILAKYRASTENILKLSGKIDIAEKTLLPLIINRSTFFDELIWLAKAVDDALSYQQ